VRRLSLVWVALLLLSSGCPKHDDDEESKAPRRSKSSATATATAPAATAAVTPPPKVSAGAPPAFYGDDAAFQGEAALVGALAALGGAPHSSEEPSQFEASWVGREAQIQLERAKRGELPHTTAQIAGTGCIAFSENGIARRVLVGAFAPNQPVEETSFSAAGSPILWFRSDRGNPTRLEWAFFHRGPNLVLYQTKLGTKPLEAVKPPEGFPEHVLDRARECLAAVGARNPAVGAGTTALLPPPPVEPAAGPKVFGALAHGSTSGRWGVGARRTSPADAKQAALQFCGRDDCKIQFEFGKGDCVVVSHGAGKFVAWGWGPGHDTPNRNMLDYCKKQGQTCTVQGEWCNE
jgi:uncharacterized protein DUF4189